MLGLRWTTFENLPIVGIRRARRPWMMKHHSDISRLKQSVYKCLSTIYEHHPQLTSQNSQFLLSVTKMMDSTYRVFFSLVPPLKVQSTTKLILARLGVSRPIYANVDSPNLGFPYFNFLGGYQWRKKTPCSYQYTLYIIQNIKLWADLCSKVSNKICTKNVRMGLNLNESWFTKSCLNTNRPTGNGFLCAGPWRALDNRTSEYTIHCQQPSGENMTRFNHIHTWTWVLQPS